MTDSEINCHSATVNTKLTDLRLLQELSAELRGVIPVLVPSVTRSATPEKLCYEVLLFSDAQKKHCAEFSGTNQHYTIQQDLKEISLYPRLMTTPFSSGSRVPLESFREGLTRSGLLGGRLSEKKDQAAFILEHWWSTLKHTTPRLYEANMELIIEVTRLFGQYVYQITEFALWATDVMKIVADTNFVYAPAIDMTVHYTAAGYVKFLQAASSNAGQMLSRLAENAFRPYQYGANPLSILITCHEPVMSGSIANTSKVGKSTLLKIIEDTVLSRCYPNAGHHTFNIPTRETKKPNATSWLELLTVDIGRYVVLFDDMSPSLFFGQETKLSTIKHFLAGESTFEGLRSIISTNMNLLPTDDPKNTSHNEEVLRLANLKQRRSGSEFDIHAFLGRFEIFGLKKVGAKKLLDFQHQMKQSVAARVAFGRVLYRFYCKCFEEVHLLASNMTSTTDSLRPTVPINDAEGDAVEVSTVLITTPTKKRGRPPSQHSPIRSPAKRGRPAFRITQTK
ncbi:hypothetical protein HDE_04234 [Halotydeus destructor]|nr:hypothetical protein HDE_04234 [Halotydeus destructor]